ncbi:6-bladed beta-propeller protein [Chitinophaga costaii]|uniref:6-bladed beta-propeller protein n=1 Tax=Chitinophaga costaii TaxID=1335309 RepID=A0A1C4EFP4_9BACT|nr:6-bladed beta-propeller [Chitinophaga costaii]PUZ23857.1 6-bladed beta-propeller [Chitinophaga costaii]SCC42370.1 6-bladed beta-propeller protein [Chitinophaga costaii]
MPIKWSVLLFGWILWAGVAAAQDIIPTDTSHFTTIRIDPANTMGGNVSDVFASVNYIPLETTPESLLGEVSQLAILNGYYLVLDYDKNAIFIFTNSGKYHAKIKGGDQRIGHFMVNKWTNQVAYSGDNYQTITYCDLDGKVVKQDANITPEGLPALYSNSFFVGAKEVISYFTYLNIDTTSKYYNAYYWSLLKYGNPVYALGMPYTAAQTKIDVILANLTTMTTSGIDTAFLLAKPYEYGLYTVTPHTIRLAYQFIFPQSLSLPPDFLTNPVYNLKRIKYVDDHRDLIYSLNNYYQVGDNLLWRECSMSSNKEEYLLYNLTSGNLFAIKHILPDALSYYLPFYETISSIFDNVGFAYCDGASLYTSVSSLAMFKTKEENKDKNIVLPAVLQTYFNKGNARDNPVLVQLQLKKEL